MILPFHFTLLLVFSSATSPPPSSTKTDDRLLKSSSSELLSSLASEFLVWHDATLASDKGVRVIRKFLKSPQLDEKYRTDLSILTVDYAYAYEDVDAMDNLFRVFSKCILHNYLTTNEPPSVMYYFGAIVQIESALYFYTSATTLLNADVKTKGQAIAMKYRDYLFGQMESKPQFHRINNFLYKLMNRNYYSAHSLTVQLNIILTDTPLDNPRLYLLIKLCMAHLTTQHATRKITRNGFSYTDPNWHAWLYTIGHAHAKMDNFRSLLILDALLMQKNNVANVVALLYFSSEKVKFYLSRMSKLGPAKLFPLVKGSNRLFVLFLSVLLSGKQEPFLKPLFEMDSRNVDRSFLQKLYEYVKEKPDLFTYELLTNPDFIKHFETLNQEVFHMAHLENSFADIPSRLLVISEDDKENEQLLAKLKEAIPQSAATFVGADGKTRPHIIPRMQEVAAYANYFSVVKALNLPNSHSPEVFTYATPLLLSTQNYNNTMTDKILQSDEELRNFLLSNVEIKDPQSLCYQYYAMWLYTVRRLTQNQIALHYLHITADSDKQDSLFLQKLDSLTVKAEDARQREAQHIQILQHLLTHRAFFLKKANCEKIVAVLNNLECTLIERDILIVNLSEALLGFGVTPWYLSIETQAFDLLENLSEKTIADNPEYSLLVVQFAIYLGWRPDSRQPDIILFKKFVEVYNSKERPVLKVTFFRILNSILAHYHYGLSQNDYESARAIDLIFGDLWRGSILIEFFSVHIHPVIRRLLLAQPFYPHLALATYSFCLGSPRNVVKNAEHHKIFRAHVLSGKPVDMPGVTNVFNCFLNELPRLLWKDFSFNPNGSWDERMTLSRAFMMLPGKFNHLLPIGGHWQLLYGYFYKLLPRIELILTLCLEEYLSEVAGETHDIGELSVLHVWKNMTDEEVDNFCKSKLPKPKALPTAQSSNEDKKQEVSPLNVESVATLAPPSSSISSNSSMQAPPQLKTLSQQKKPLKKEKQNTQKAIKQPSKVQIQTETDDEDEEEQERIKKDLEVNSLSVETSRVIGSQLPHIASFFTFGDDGTADPKPNLSTEDMKFIMDTMQTSSFPFLLSSRFHQLITGKGSQLEIYNDWHQFLKHFKLAQKRSRSEVWDPEDYSFAVDEFSSRDNTNRLKMAVKVLTDLDSENTLLMKRLWSRCKYSSAQPGEFEKLSVAFVKAKGNDPVKVEHGTLVIREQLTEEQLKTELVKYLDFDSTLGKQGKKVEAKESIQAATTTTAYNVPLTRTAAAVQTQSSLPSVEKSKNESNELSLPSTFSETVRTQASQPKRSLLDESLYEPQDLFSQTKESKLSYWKQLSDAAKNDIALESNVPSVDLVIPSLMDKFKEVEIIKSEDGTIDFKDLLDNDAEFLAFDLELTGIGELKGPKGPPTIEERVKAVKTNSIVQVGLMFMRRAKSTYPNLINVEPVGPVYKIAVCKEQDPHSVQWQKESLLYLQQHGFSLEKWYKKAIPQSQLTLVWEMMQSKTLIVHNGLIDLMHIVQALNLPLDCKNGDQLQKLFTYNKIKFYDSRVHMFQKFGLTGEQGTLGELAGQFLLGDKDRVNLHDAARDAFLTGFLIAKCGPLHAKNFCVLREFEGKEDKEVARVQQQPNTSLVMNYPAQPYLSHLPHYAHHQAIPGYYTNYYPQIHYQPHLPGMNPQPQNANYYNQYFFYNQ